MALSPLQALWLATETVHEETDSYGSPNDLFYVMNFLDLSVGITPDLATRVASIPVSNFAVAAQQVDLLSCWQRVEQRLRKQLNPPQDWTKVQLLGDLAQAIHFAAR